MKKIKRKQIDFGGTNDQYIRGDGALDNLDDFYITLSAESSQYSQFNQTELTCDKTPKEIVDAIKQGRKFVWTLIAGAGSPSYRFDLSTTRGQLSVVRETRYQYNVLLYCYNGKDNKGLDVRFGLTYVSNTNTARITANATYVDNVVEHPKEVLVCEYNISNHTVSKTPEEIYNARQAGKVVICKRNEVIYNLTIAQQSNNTYLIVFTATIATNDPPELAYIWYFNNEWSDNVKLLQTTFRTINHEQIYDANLGDINIFDGYYFPNAVQDYDGNWYGAVVIGDQVVLDKNLHTKHYNDGTEISYGQNNNSDTIAYYYYPDGVETNEKEFGLLYNQAAVMKGEEYSDDVPSGVQGIAPIGWHIPSNSEYAKLCNYISKQKRFNLINFSDTNNRIGKSLASTHHWISSDQTHSIGNNQEENNKTGFNAKPAGGFGIDSLWYPSGINKFATFWTSTQGVRYMLYATQATCSYTLGDVTKRGCSVRCVSNLTPIQFRDWYVNTYGSMQHILNTEETEEVFICNYNNGSVDKTTTEIRDAYYAGKEVICKINNGGILRLYKITDTQIQFTGVVSNISYSLLCTNNTWSYAFYTLATPSNIPTSASDVHALPDSTKYGASINLDFDDNYTEVTDTTGKNPANEGWFERSGTDPNYVYTLTEDTTPVSGKTYYKGGTYIITATLKDQDGNTLGTQQQIDLPLESVVVDGQYNSTTQNVELVLKNGHTIAFSVADLVSGLQSTLVSGTNIKTINNESILGSGNISITDVVRCTYTETDNVTHTGTMSLTLQQLSDAVDANKVVILTRGNLVYTLASKDAIGARFVCVQGGAVYVIAYHVDDTLWHCYNFNIQEVLVSGTNIKTINNTSILGNGNINIREIPAPSEANNGKMLKIVNGEWTIVPMAPAYHHAGTKTVAQLIPDLLVAANEGNVYNITDSGITTEHFIEGAGQPIRVGDNVGIAKVDDSYKFDLLSGFIDTSGFALKSEMSITDGTDTDADKTTIQLKSGLTKQVLIQHQDISGKADVNGNYPNMTVGIANNVDDKVTVEEPFLFRPSPNFKGALGKSVRINEIKGRSNRWNQLVDTATSSVVLTSGHKYFTNISGTTSIQTGSGNSQAVTGGTDNVIDLTLVFGTGNEPETVEDFEVWLAANVGLKDYYPYDAGDLLSVKLKEFESIGFNQWDEEIELGAVDYTNGNIANNNSGLYWRTKDYIKVIPSKEYYNKIANGYTTGTSNNTVVFYDYNKQYIGGIQNVGNNVITTPQNCYYLKISFYYTVAREVPPEGICINISSSRNSEYEPYWKRTIPFDVTKITGINPTTNVRELVFPNGMRSAGSVYDRIYSDGKLVKAIVNIGSTNIGSLSWQGTTTTTSGVVRFKTNDLTSLVRGVSISSIGNIICPKYLTVSSNSTNACNVGIAVDPYGVVTVYDSNYAYYTPWKTDMAAFPIFYQLANPITYTDLQDENGEPVELPLITKASNGGTERLLPQNESSMEVIAPILNIEYQVDVEDRIARLEEIVEGYESGDAFKNARTGFIIDQRGIITDPDTMVSANYYISDRNIDRAFAGILKYEDIVNDDNYVSDNATQGSVNNNAISWIRKNAHCFVGKWNGSQMRLRQLSDTDKSKFTDGTDATSYITNAAAADSDTYDVWLKFKKDIYYRCFPIIPTGSNTPNEDLQLVVFCKDKPDNPEQWEKFDKNKLIGIYEGYAVDNKAFSISGMQATNRIIQTNAKAYARNRGTGFKLVDLQANNIVALMFYGIYSTLNSQAVCGSGTYNNDGSTYCPKKTGLCDYLGVTDTDIVNGNSASPTVADIQVGYGATIKSINFLCLENWWGDVYEWMDDLQVMQARRPSSVATANPSYYVDDYINDYIANHSGATGAIINLAGVDTLLTPTDIADSTKFAEDDRFISIKDINGNIVRIINTGLKATEGNIAKCNLGAHGDVFPKALGGDYNVNSYCDYGNVNSVGYVALRSFVAAFSYGGVAYLNLANGAGFSYSGIGFRLLYEGNSTNTTVVAEGDTW